jgi:molybdate transport system permease protein
VVVDALVHAPLVLPPVVVGFFLLLLLGVEGPIGRMLSDWFGVRLVFTSEGASLAAGVMAFPLMVRAVRLSVEAIDPGLEEAARTLGARAFDRFASITLPLAAPGILGAAVLGFAACLGEFGAVITFAASIPGETQTLPLAIYAALQEPGGEARALRLAGLSLALALGAVALAEALIAYGRKRAGR